MAQPRTRSDSAIQPPRQLNGLGWALTIFALVGALLFSTKAIVIKLAYADPTSSVDAITLLALRMMMALPIYLIIGGLAVRERKRTGQALPPRGAVVKALLVGILVPAFAAV